MPKVFPQSRHPVGGRPPDLELAELAERGLEVADGAPTLPKVVQVDGNVGKSALQRRIHRARAVVQSLVIMGRTWSPSSRSSPAQRHASRAVSSGTSAASRMAAVQACSAPVPGSALAARRAVTVSAYALASSSTSSRKRPRAAASRPSPDPTSRRPCRQSKP